MFADHVHGGRLGPLLALFLGEAHLSPLLQALEILVQQTVGMKIDFAPIWSEDGAVIGSISITRP